MLREPVDGSVTRSKNKNATDDLSPIWSICRNTIGRSSQAFADKIRRLKIPVNSCVRKKSAHAVTYHSSPYLINPPDCWIIATSTRAGDFLYVIQPDKMKETPHLGQSGQCDGIR